MKFVIFLHTVTQSFRHIIVLSGFGTISYCKHSPTCSEYALSAIKKDGAIIGVIKGTWRVLQCW